MDGEHYLMGVVIIFLILLTICSVALLGGV